MGPDVVISHTRVYNIWEDNMLSVPARDMNICDLRANFAYDVMLYTTENSNKRRSHTRRYFG